MGDATKRVLERLARTRTNAEFLNNLTKDAWPETNSRFRLEQGGEAEFGPFLVC